MPQHLRIEQPISQRAIFYCKFCNPDLERVRDVF